MLVPALLGAVKVASAIHALRRCPIGSAKRIRQVILGQQGNDMKYFTQTSSKGATPSVLIRALVTDINLRGKMTGQGDQPGISYYSYDWR